MSRTKLAAVTLTAALLTLLAGGPLGAAAQKPVADAPAFSTSKTITRVHREASGADTVAYTKPFSVSVDQTDKLRGRQLVNVSWSGAHPTLGKVQNPNAAAAALTEYPVVLMECRGDDSPGAPTDPSTCFTSTIGERKHESFDPFPAWRVDRAATPAERAPLIGYPDPRPAVCPPPVSPIARYIPFVAADNTVYRPLSGHTRDLNCGPVLAPEMVTVEQPDAPPGNTTYGVSDGNGNGSAKFVVLTGDENASLGCSQQVRCSLVVIPIVGISCDVTGSGVPAESAEDVDANCRAQGKNPPGTLLPTASEFYVDPAVTGEFWWSASNWNNRITVPLGFGTPSNICESGDNRVPLDIFGSELMTQATTQWAPLFCTSKELFRFRHVQTGEPQAKGALAAGTAETAMVSLAPPDGYPKPTVNAPIGVTGFAVSYLIDDANRNQVSNLRLSPRLIAKALTESYPANGDLRSAYAGLPDDNPYKALARNPFDMSTDPEFIALNPGIGDHSGISAPTSSTLLTLSGTSDVTFALTSYLNADPEARAWLNGTPDPWGMVVNPGYRNIELPQPSWPLLDTFTSPDVTLYGGCLPPESWRKIPPVPIGPLVGSPVSTLSISGQRLQYANSNSRTRCQVLVDLGNNPVGAQLAAVGRQTPGFRFMLSVTSLADAAFLELNTAALQSTATIAHPEARFTDATGRTFVSASDDTLRTAVKLAKPDLATGTWPMPYDALRGPAGVNAYPGTMVVYASIPTTGLPAEDATNLGKFLIFAALFGQSQGLDIGKLPPGYLPMTVQNGLGDFVVYTVAAAAAVGNQLGIVPPVAPRPETPVIPPALQQGLPGPVVVPFVPPAAAVVQQGVPASGPPPATVLPVPGGAAAPVAQAGVIGSTPDLSSAFARWALPIALIVALAAGLVGVGTRVGFSVRHLIRSRR